MRSTAIVALALSSSTLACGESITAPICDAADLASALSSAAPGDTVLIGRCTIDGSFTVPSGVTLAGISRIESTIDGLANSSVITLTPGPTPACIRDLTIESPGRIGVRASGAGAVCLESVDVHATLGAGVGVELLTSLTLTDVIISGTIDETNARLVPPTVTSTEASTYGLAILRTLDAQLENVRVHGFATTGVLTFASNLTFTRGNLRGNRQLGFWSSGGTITLDDVDASETLQDYGLLPPYGLVFTDAAVVTTDHVRADDGDGVGMVMFDVEARHTNVQVNRNPYGGMMAEHSSVFEVSGHLEGNRKFGVATWCAENVRIQDAEIVATSTVITIPAGMAPFDMGDGIQMVESTIGAAISNVTLSGNARVGLLLDLGGQTLANGALQNITVSGTGTSLGVIGQGGVFPSGWDAQVSRNAQLAANDSAFSGMLETVEIVGPCDRPRPDRFASGGLTAVTGP